jgi:hypothetical protein
MDETVELAEDDFREIDSSIHKLKEYKELFTK